jgi:hypothetical protein
MPKENSLDNVASLDNDDFLRVVTNDGNSRKIKWEVLKAVIDANTTTKINDYYYFQDAENPVENDYRIFANENYLLFQRYESSAWSTVFDIGGSISTYDAIVIKKQVGADLYVKDGEEYRNLIRNATFDDGTVLGDIEGITYVLANDEVKIFKRDGNFTNSVIQSDKSQSHTGTEFSLMITTPDVEGFISNGIKVDGTIGSGVTVQLKVYEQTDLTTPIWQSCSDSQFALGHGNVVQTDGTINAQKRFYGVGNRDLKYVLTFSSEITLNGSTSDGTDIYMETSRCLVKGFSPILMNSDGNVGIGVDSPSHKLDVAGGINTDNSYLFDGINALTLSKGPTDSYYSSIFIGDGAGNSSAHRQTVMGRRAGFLATGLYQTTSGFYSGYRNTGDYQTAFGSYAGYLNTGTLSTTIGGYAGYQNSGARVTGLGYKATQENTGNDVVAIGHEAGYQNTSDNQFIVKQGNVNSTPLIQGDFATGNVGIGTTSPSSTLEVNGYTKLGSDAPAIKKKKITGTTPSTGGTSSYSTGIAFSKILSLNVLVTGTSGEKMLPESLEIDDPSYYHAYIESDGDIGIYVPSTGTNVGSSSFVAVIEYEE